MKSTTIGLVESVLLGHALVATVARDHGIRVLIIKGPILAIQGLRVTKVSADVDVLVDPAAYPQFLEALAGLGWHERPSPESPPMLVPYHSTTLIHDLWGCDIDAHHSFPGIFADPQVAFDVLWQRRTSVSIAAVEVPTSDVLGNAVIAVLHALRDPAKERSREDIAGVTETLRAHLNENLKQELYQLAAVLRSLTVLKPWFDDLEIAVPQGDLTPQEQYLWDLRRADSTRAIRFARQLRDTPWFRRPAIVWRTLWLPEFQIRMEHPETGPGRRGLFVARLRRWVAGARALPRAFRTLATADRTLHEDD